MTAGVFIPAAVLAFSGLLPVARAVAVDGDEVRLVGGAVRNGLLGLAVEEVDLATTALPDQVIERARAAGLKAIPTGYRHGTVTVVANGRGFEITTLRRDVATDGRHAVVAYGRDWTEDAARRDFTMNALYADLDGRVYDPLGGLADCLAGRVRFIGDAEERIREDYLRILRFFRFSAAYGRAVDRAGLAACARLYEGIGAVSRERIAGEIKKLVTGPRAGMALRAMASIGLATALFGPNFRLCAAGRVRRLRNETGMGADAMTMLGALTVGEAGDIARLVEDLRLSRAERARLEEGFAARGLIGSHAAPDLRRARLLFGKAATLDALAAMFARGNGRDWTICRDLSVMLEAWTPPDFPVKAGDLLAKGAEPGPALGAQLAALRQQWLLEVCRDPEPADKSH